MEVSGELHTSAALLGKQPLIPIDCRMDGPQRCSVQLERRRMYCLC